MLVTFSLVLYKTPFAQIQQLLQVMTHIPQLKTQVFIIDNSPTPEIKTKVAQFTGVTYIFAGENLGYGPAHNIGMRRAAKLKAQYHIIINPDISFTARNLLKMIKYMDTHPQVGQLMPKVTDRQGKIQYLAKLLPSPMYFIFRRFLPLLPLTQRWNYLQELQFTKYNTIIPAPYLSGCFMFFRLAVIKKIGYFDERFFMYPEDIDISRRMFQVSQLVYFPEATIIHDHARASYKNIRMLFIHVTQMIKYFNKWGWVFDWERNRINRITLQELQLPKK